MDSYLNINTQYGYIKIVSCTIQDDLINLEIESDIQATFDEWDDMLISCNEKKYPLIVNASNKKKLDEDKYTWKILCYGRANINKGNFILNTPYGDIPVNCMLVNPIADTKDIAPGTEIGNIKLYANKKQSQNYTVVSLTATNSNNNLVNIKFDIDNVLAYDKEGTSYKAMKYIEEQNQFYFNIPSDEIEKVKITAIEQGIISKKFNMSELEKACSNSGFELKAYLREGLNNPLLKEFWETESFIENIKLPTENIISVNKVIRIDKYKLAILVIRSGPDKVEVVVNKLNKNISQVDYGFDYDSYEGYSQFSKDECDYLVINVDSSETNISLIVKQLWIKTDGDWNIQF